MRTARSPRTLAATVALAGLAALLLLLTVALAPQVDVLDGDDGPEPVTEPDTLVIGVADGFPGLSALDSEEIPEGFAIDVATYIAGGLEAAPDYRPLGSDEPEDALREGTVDMVVAPYAVTQDRKYEVTFAGPYYVAHQDILVRQDDRSIRDVGDLEGKRLCQASGSGSWRQVTENRKVAAALVPAASYTECAEALAAGRVDAVSADDLILAGLATTAPGATVLNAPFTDVRYGVGLPEGDREGCRAVNRILTRMYQSGAAATMLDRWFGGSGLELPGTLPRFEGCA